jgi:hypothetical protein
MVRHDRIGIEIVIQVLRSVVDGSLHQRGDGFLAKIERSGACGIEVSVHPDEGLACGLFAGWRTKTMRKAAVEVPGHKEQFVPRVQGATMEFHGKEVVGVSEESHRR